VILTVRDILKAARGSLLSGYPTSLCERVSIDTRTLRPGDVFFALRGPHFDGHQFLSAAAQKRAQAVVLERLDPDLRLAPDSAPDLIQVPDTLAALQDVARFVRSRAKKTTFIGLTGSNGKTTTKDMLAAILRRAGKTLSTRGNLNNHIGLPLMLTELELDHQYALLEMGTSKKGDMDLLVDLVQPKVGLITNVGKDHLEFFGSPEGVLEVNRKLYESLPQDGAAIINLEDPLLRNFSGRLACRTVTYGRLPEAHVRATDIVASPTPLRFTLEIGQEKFPVTLQGFGEIQVLNAMAAAATAHALGISSADIAVGLGSFKPAAMRMEVRPRPDGAMIINDAYNANPSSMHASIESFCRSYPDRPRWLVLGDMRELGTVSRQEHEELGRWIGTQAVDRVYLYGRDTRFVLKGLSSQKFRGAVERYRKKRYLIEAVERQLKAVPKAAILFKASRSLKLEQVSHALSSTPS
jgi:UDP-N-acetylmuramoyl-tripeptide--D-alanyl-D-alanine ligase